MNISYRPARDADIVFCERLHRDGMRPYVDPIWGWDEEFQHARFKRVWAPQNVKIFSVDGNEFGYLETHEIDGDLKLDNFFVEASQRGKGIGTKILLELIETNKSRYSRITLNVLHNNPASNLYKRVGFRFVKVKDQVHEYEYLTR